jgi:hypothetical protein
MMVMVKMGRKTHQQKIADGPVLVKNILRRTTTHSVQASSRAREGPAFGRARTTPIAAGGATIRKLDLLTFFPWQSNFRAQPTQGDN